MKLSSKDSSITLFQLAVLSSSVLTISGCTKESRIDCGHVAMAIEHGNYDNLDPYNRIFAEQVSAQLSHRSGALFLQAFSACRKITR